MLTAAATSFAKRRPSRGRYDCVIVGAGHNGLVAAAYLAAAGRSVCLLERRHLVGGAAVTEELLPGFRCSRASYLLSLFRPRILHDLELTSRYGLRVYSRPVSSYTPVLDSGRSLVLASDRQRTLESIGQFSRLDADRFERYEHEMAAVASAIEPLLDTRPFRLDRLFAASGQRVPLSERLSELRTAAPLCRLLLDLGHRLPQLYRLLTAPAAKVLDSWFVSEPLKATLATDSVIGAMTSPRTPGSGYVLLHHVMGEVNGVRGAWGFVRGGMGALSQAIAQCAADRGAEIVTEAEVQQIAASKGRAQGVQLSDGTFVEARAVLSNATPRVTFEQLVDRSELPDEFLSDIGSFDYESPVTKLNLAVSQLPSFTADPNPPGGNCPAHFSATIHLNSDSSQLIEDSFAACRRGEFNERPVIEMTVPSAVDDSLAPPGAHVVQLFTQYTPKLLRGREWTEADREAYKRTVLSSIDNYAPGFSQSVLACDLLTPADLESVFGLTGGNIFHGSMSLDQLYFMRPCPAASDYRSPLSGLYLCGSGAHPGGGVMGAAGRLCSLELLRDWGMGRV